jgi:hypothetical protein
MRVTPFVVYAAARLKVGCGSVPVSSSFETGGFAMEGRDRARPPTRFPEF